MIHRFGDFVLDGGARRLLRNGVDVHLSPKAFDLLNALIVSRARALSKAELLELIWPSAYVEEANLAGIVLEIRRALRDTAATPRFIRTVYGYGYHFVGDVAEDGHSMDSMAPAAERSWLMFEHRQLPLMAGQQIIGRGPDAAVSLDLPGVSRHHARISVVGTAATIEDLGSKNGTLVNGQRISSEIELADGDRIGIGGAIFIFRIASAIGPTATIVV